MIPISLEDNEQISYLAEGMTVNFISIYINIIISAFAIPSDMSPAILFMENATAMTYLALLPIQFHSTTQRVTKCCTPPSDVS